MSFIRRTLSLCSGRASHSRGVGVVLVLLSATYVDAPAEEVSHRAAFNSITANELFEHVDVLADDSLEGRSAGSRGGLAAARYITDQLEQIGVKPAGPRDGFYQTFSANYRNILGALPGHDPVLADEWIVVSAHFDHVGYGTPRTSFGPIGYIHNGADDNASGVSVVLELAEALVQHGRPLKRSVLFAFWDGEEQGLLGSKHWTANPTTPLSNVRLCINSDMVGRLRKGHLIIGGTRSGYGLRRLAATCDLVDPMWLDFDWKLKENSDHWPFVTHRVPTLFLFTGLHENYHRPSDDAELILADGMQEVTRYLLGLVQRAADAEQLPAYRATWRSESPFTQRHREKPLPPVQLRLGISYRELDASVQITVVHHGSPAARAGLETGDRILAVGDTRLHAEGDFAQLLTASPVETTLTVRRAGTGPSKAEPDAEPEQVEITLAGKPTRIGIAWRADEAEPNTVYLTRVVSNSPASAAGLRVHDRIQAVNGKTFIGINEFTRLITTALDEQTERLELLVESRGRIHDTVVESWD